MTNEFKELVRHEWMSGDSLVAGRMLYESVPMGSRGSWARQLLSVAVGLTDSCTRYVDELIALQPSEWSRSAELFRSIRRVTIQCSPEPYSPYKEECILMLAENVAKVVFNDGLGEDEFDEDSGWWVTSCLSSLVNHLGTPGLRESMWNDILACTENAAGWRGEPMVKK